uniref:SANT domain-containing protein n=1 Tax=Elaeophora elaphi TaxID=1147741 RepID=A0A0R3RSG5_9BILA
MSAQLGSKVDEEAKSEPGSSTSTALISRRRIIYRPFSLNPQTSTTTVTSTIRDTLIAVRDAVAASIMTTSSLSTPPITSTTANATADTSTTSTQSSNVSQQHTVCFTNSETNAAAPAISGINKVPRRWEQWNSSEINAFFEGIKLYGKDFEQMAKLMARRKLNKDKDQVRNYYFNSLKLLRSSTRIDETLMAGVPRDVKELFILINGFEWKRRACGKFDQAKFQQLVMEGSTYEKKRKKKQLVLIRTPVCPSLQKFFPSCSSSPLPSHIFICLTPKTEADRYFVEQRGQNPLIRIRVAIGDQLSRIFSFLKIKWNLRMQKLLGTMAKEEEQVRVVLYPDKTTRVGKIIVNLYEATPTIFSINRQICKLCIPKVIFTACVSIGNIFHTKFMLIRELQRTGTIEQSNESSKRRGANASEETSDVEMASATEDDDDGPFTINGNKLRNGLTEKNVLKATVTELYYLCGKESEIKLVYSTGMKRMGDPEPWRIFLHLLDRGYGDSLCKSLADPQRVAESDEFIEQKWQERIRKRCKPANNIAEQSSGRLTTTNEVMETTEAAAHEMVEAENSAFMQQLESLRVKKRARPFHQRFPGKNNGIIQSVALNPPSGHQPIATAGYQLTDPVFGSQNERSGATQSDQFAFTGGDVASSNAVAGKIRSRDGSGRMWSDVGISGFKSDDNADGVRSGSGYFLQEKNVSSHPTQGHHSVTEARYQLVNPVFVAHKAATSTSSVQFISSSSSSAGGIGQNVSNFVQDTNVPMCSTQEMTAVRYQTARPVFIPENAHSTPGQFVLPISDTASSDNEHFIREDSVIQKILPTIVVNMESSEGCDAGDRDSIPSSPVKESSLLRELHSAPSMDKSIEVMLQENSTECYRFVEQFASTMNSRSNVVSNAINAENEITRIAQQLAQSADDALRSVDGNCGRIRPGDGNNSAVSVSDMNVTKSVDPGPVKIRSSNNKEETQIPESFSRIRGCRER